MALLEVRGLSKDFGGLAALADVDFDVNQGEIFGLIGPNGAGKTTFFNVLSGVLKPSRGKVVYKGEDITGLRFHLVAAKGIVRTFQLTVLFDEMTVTENIMVAHHLHYRKGLLATLMHSGQDREEIEKSTRDIIDFLGLTHLKNEVAKSLPHGHQRILGVAIGLAARPDLLMLDEPVTGMNPEEATTMMGIIKRIRERGTTIIIVEHNIGVIMGICDRIVVLNFGRKIAEGQPEQIKNNKDVIEAYLGAEEPAAR